MAAAGVMQEQEARVHSIECNATMINFDESLPFVFQRTLHIICPVMPTSWIFRVYFERSPDDNSVSALVTVRRTDNGRNPINLNFTILLVFPNLEIDNPAWWFTIPSFMGGESRTENLMGFVSSETMMEYSDQTVDLGVVFDVYACH